jgi:hypothetical protein
MVTFFNTGLASIFAKNDLANVMHFDRHGKAKVVIMLNLNPNLFSDQMRNIIWEINTMLAMRQAPHQAFGHQWSSSNALL